MLGFNLLAAPLWPGEAARTAAERIAPSLHLFAATQNLFEKGAYTGPLSC